jgi:inner membrane transporter RhtA
LTTDGVGPRRRAAAIPPELFFVLGAISQYVGAAIAVGLFDRLDARAVAWLRVLFGAMIALVIGLAWRRRWSRGEVRAAAIFGTALALMNLFFYLAIERLPLGTAVAIEFLGPIAIAAWGSRNRRAIVSLVLAVVGIALLMEVSFDADPLGLLFIVLAGACWAGYIVLGHRVAASANGVTGLGLSMLIGAAAVAPFAAFTSGPAWTSPSIVGLLLLLALLSSVLPYGFDQYVLQRLHPARFALLLALLPATATVVGAIWLSQIPTTIEFVGIGLVVAALALRDRSEEQPHDAS